MSALMSISGSIHGLYRLTECKGKVLTAEELAELKEMARRAEKIYQRLEGKNNGKFSCNQRIIGEANYRCWP